MKKAGYKELTVYQISYESALKIHQLTKSFPPEEKFSLIDQIRRSSRSVVANIGEGYRTRQYPKNFAKKLSISNGEATETQIWLDFAKDFGYIKQDIYEELYEKYERVGSMLGNMITAPEKFKPRS
ncbi:MAG: four helix bundle protein [Bacteroidetes bacterium]|nr:four helix bundle protein [Bacteroidota bacterium]